MNMVPLALAKEGTDRVSRERIVRPNGEYAGHEGFDCQRLFEPLQGGNYGRSCGTRATRPS